MAVNYACVKFIDSLRFLTKLLDDGLAKRLSSY